MLTSEEFLTMYELKKWATTIKLSNQATTKIKITELLDKLGFSEWG